MYCLDTYALVEVYNGTLVLEDFFEDAMLVIPSTTLAELYIVLLRRYDKKTAEHWCKRLSVFVQELQTKTLLQAMNYKYAHRKKKISFFDSVGYVYARENNLTFVTGDEAFAQEKGVLFLQ